MLKNILKRENLMPVIVLSAICLAVAGLLGVVNMLSAPLIREAEEKAIEQSLSEVISGGDFGEAYVPEGAPESVKAVYSDKGGGGFAVVLESQKSYSGQPIFITVGISPSGEILGARITKTQETKFTDLVADFTAGLAGSTADEVAGADLVSGATVSSSAVRDTVLEALSALGFYEPPVIEEGPVEEKPFPVYTLIGCIIILICVGAVAVYLVFEKRRMRNDKQ